MEERPQEDTERWATCNPDGSAGKGSACNARDPGSIPGSGRSPGEGIGCPLQYSWASLVAQLVKNPPAMHEIWVLSLGWEDPLEKDKATHSSILAWRIPWTVHGVAKSWTPLSDFHFTICNPRIEPRSPRCRILYCLSPQGSPRILEWAAWPFSRGSSQPRNPAGVSCIAGGFFAS